jgi:hypothetical protein
MIFSHICAKQVYDAKGLEGPLSSKNNEYP